MDKIEILAAFQIREMGRKTCKNHEKSKIFEESIFRLLTGFQNRQRERKGKTYLVSVHKPVFREYRIPDF